MELQENLSNAMNTLRKQCNLSVAALSKNVGIAKSSMQDILDGTGNPQIETLEKIASHLSVNSLTLLSCTCQLQQPKALLLLGGIRAVNRLSPERQREFASLFSQMLYLLDGKAE